MSTKKRVITESRVREAIREGRKVLAATKSTIITPSARDLARQHGIEFRAETEDATSSRQVHPSALQRKIVVGSDHGGFLYKKELTQYLHSLGWTTFDVGTNSPDSCDYPDFAFAVARAIVDEYAHVGLMIDGAGVGSSIVCNKVPGIRAALAYNEFTAWNARAHNNANVLTLGSRTMGIEVCKRILAVFLDTPFEGGRHAARVQKIEDVERRFSTK